MSMSRLLFVLFLFFGIFECPFVIAQRSNQPSIFQLKECIYHGDYWGLQEFSQEMARWDLNEESSRTLKALSAYFNGDNEDALALIQPFLGKDGDSAYASLYARCLAGQGKKIEAINFLEGRRRSDNHPALLVNLAMLYLSAEQLQDAVAVATKVINADSVYADAYYIRGLALWKQGDPAAAIDDIEKAISIRWRGPYRNEGTPHLLCGIYYSKTGEIDKAVKTLEVVMNNLPDFEDAALLLWKLQTELGRFTEALAVSEELLKTNPNSSNSSGLYVKSLMNLNRPTEAEVYIIQWLNRSPNDELATNLMAHILFAKGALLDAFEFAEKSKQLAPLDVQAQATFVKVGLHIFTTNEFSNTGRDRQEFMDELSQIAKQLCEATRWEIEEHVKLLAAVYTAFGREDEFNVLMQERFAANPNARTTR